MPRKIGPLVLPAAKNTLQLAVSLKSVNGEFNEYHFQLGSSYSQIDSDTAAALGLLSHKTLVGRSAVANGELKIDYLCATTIQILGVEASLVLKVSPGQPNLLGLDAMFLFGFEVNMLTLQFSIADAPLPIPMVADKFRWLHWDAMLHSFHLTPMDLVPIAELPPPEDSFRELVNVRKTRLVDLGTASMSPWMLPKCARTFIIDLGTC